LTCTSQPRSLPSIWPPNAEWSYVVPLLFFSSLLRPPPTSTLFPYTTLFRSTRAAHIHHPATALVAVPVHLSPELSLRRGTEPPRSEEHTSELQSRGHLVCRLLLEKKNQRVPGGDRGGPQRIPRG